MHGSCQCGSTWQIAKGSDATAEAESRLKKAASADSELSHILYIQNRLMMQWVAFDHPLVMGRVDKICFSLFTTRLGTISRICH